MLKKASVLIFVCIVALAVPDALFAQEHEHHSGAQPKDAENEQPAPEKPGQDPMDHEHLGHSGAHETGDTSAFRVPHGREGSGTSWMPDSSPVFAHHFMVGDWMLMLHYSVEAGYDVQWSDRGSHRLASVNWIMGMASRPLLGGELMLRSMLSAEPATMGGELQLPLLLQSGETYGGSPLHDRQHPHDLFMELAASYRHPVGDALGLELYAAPSGEPALGPTAFMHRASAMYNPFPPIGHHWQDSTHISFGVLTAGVYNKFAKLEGSIFHGSEPDEDRWNFDLGPLDSWSGRISVNPTGETSFQISYGFVKARPGETPHRVTASGTWASDDLSLTAIWGRNVDSGRASDSALIEGQFEPDGKNAPFARLEWVQKLGRDLVLPGDPEAAYDVFQASVGFVHRFTGGPVVPLIGASVNVGLVPQSIEGQYGTRFPAGVFIFIGLQPPQMSEM